METFKKSIPMILICAGLIIFCGCKKGAVMEKTNITEDKPAEPIKLSIGDTAPDFKLINQNGEKTALKDFKGKNLLVYFYPKADTPGCTKQACSVGDALPLMQADGMEAVGISPDPVDAQKAFADKFSLTFDLLSDTELKTAKAYGVWGKKMRDGVEVEGIIRSMFVIDEDGKIIEAVYGVTPEETVGKAISAIKNIQDDLLE